MNEYDILPPNTPVATTRHGMPVQMPVGEKGTQPIGNYDVSAVLSGATGFTSTDDALKTALTPAPVLDQFVPTPGGGQGMGHFAGPEDLVAHERARKAASDYLAIAEHVHHLHNETQTDLDNAGAHAALAGFDYTHPDAVQNLEKIRSQFPLAHPDTFGFQEKLLGQKLSQTGRTDLLTQKQAMRDSAAADLKTAHGITMDQLSQAPAKTGTMQGNTFVPTPESAAPGTSNPTHFQITVNDNKGKTTQRILTAAEYWNYMNKEADYRSTLAGQTPTAAAPKPTPKVFTREDDAAFAAAHGTTPTVPVKKPTAASKYF